jgi:hypothetical protein
MFTQRVHHTDYSYPCRRATLRHAHLYIWFTEEPLSRSGFEHAVKFYIAIEFTTHRCLPRYQLMSLTHKYWSDPENHKSNTEISNFSYSECECSLLWGLFWRVPTLIVYTGTWCAPRAKKTFKALKWRKVTLAHADLTTNFWSKRDKIILKKDPKRSIECVIFDIFFISLTQKLMKLHAVNHKLVEKLVLE